MLNVVITYYSPKYFIEEIRLNRLITLYPKFINPILFKITIAMAIGAINFTRNIKTDNIAPVSDPPFDISS